MQTRTSKKTGGQETNVTTSQLKAYNISEEQDEAEIAQNSDQPTSEFMLEISDPIEVQEFKLRELNRRLAARTEQESYQAELMGEFENVRKKMRLKRTPEEIQTDSAGDPPSNKATSHFKDRDGKCYTSFNKDVKRSNVEYSMPFLRMAHSDRILDVCIDELHICLDVNHARGVYLSKVHTHASLLEDHWESINLWGSMENLSVLQKDKFKHLLLFNGNYEELQEFSLADFLVTPNTLKNTIYLREALDNLELVYRCIMGNMYLGMTIVAKNFLLNEGRILATRDFEFVRSIFEGAFVRFQMEMKSRDVSTGASPLDSHELVFNFFQECFHFPLQLFSRDEEDMFKARKNNRQSSNGTLLKSASKLKNQILPSLKSSTVAKFSNKEKSPCIRHLAESLGIQSLGGENPIITCNHGSNCRYAHYTWPIGNVQRQKLVNFVSASNMKLLKTKADRDTILRIL